MGRNMFLRNVGEFISHCTGSYPRRQYSLSQKPLNIRKWENKVSSLSHKTYLFPEHPFTKRK
jgi:hypothetical protein